MAIGIELITDQSNVFDTASGFDPEIPSVVRPITYHRCRSFCANVVLCAGAVLQQWRIYRGVICFERLKLQIKMLIFLSFK